MIRKSCAPAIGAVALLVAAVASGCGTSSSTSSTATKAAGAGPASASGSGTSVSASPAGVAVTVKLSSYKTPQDGTLITGTGNRSLYVFQKDDKSTRSHNKPSTCYGACAVAWPPALASQLPAVAGQANKLLVGLTTRKDGTKQLTYGGQPLYYYVADTAAGQSTGNHLKDGFGLWIGMLPSGKLAPDGAQ